MPKSPGWAITRWDLWAVPGLALMITGLFVKTVAHNNAGTLILFVGLLLNTAFVIRRAGREQRQKDALRGK